MTIVNTPFLIYTDNPWELSLGDVRWVPNGADDPDAFACDSTGQIIPK
jgi:beta-glucosidase